MSFHLNKNKSYLLSFIIFFVILLLSGHPLQSIIPRLSYLVFFLLIIILPKFISCISTDRSASLPALAFFLVMVSVSMIANKGFTVAKYWSFFALIICTYTISKMYTNTQIINTFLKFMYYITIVAIIGYLLQLNTSLLDALPRVRNINGSEYGFGFFYVYLTDAINRNCGCFWEPGIFATYLSLALVFECFSQKNICWKRVFVYFIGILTAHSSAGYLSGLLALLILLLRLIDFKSVPLFKHILSISFLVVLLIIFLNADQIIQSTSLSENGYVLKLMSNNVKEEYRILAFMKNIQIFLSHPIAGVGYESHFFNNVNSYYFYDITTSAYFLSLFGFLGISYTVSWIYAILTQRNCDVYAKMVFLLMVLIVINKEPHGTLMFTWCLLFSLLNSKNFFHVKE